MGSQSNGKGRTKTIVYQDLSRKWKLSRAGLQECGKGFESTAECKTAGGGWRVSLRVTLQSRLPFRVRPQRSLLLA